MAKPRCSRPKDPGFVDSPSLHCGSTGLFDAQGHRALTDAGGAAIAGLLGELKQLLHWLHFGVARGGKVGAAFIDACGCCAAGPCERYQSGEGQG